MTYENSFFTHVYNFSFDGVNWLYGWACRYFLNGMSLYIYIHMQAG